MTLFEEQYTVSTRTRYFGPATVQAFHNKERSVFISLDQMDEYTKIQATIAIPFDIEFCPGDEVLVSGEDIENLYVIGILNQRSGIENKQLRMSNGITAEVKEINNSEKLSIRNNTGQLLVQFDSMSDSCTIYASSGDLNFVAPEGSVTFQAVGDIRFEGQHQISFHSNNTINLTARDTVGNRSQIGLTPHKADISGKFLNITSRRGQLNIQDTTFSGENFRGTVKTVKLFMDRLESSVNTIREKAKNVYRYVEGLLQTKSGRSRTLVESSSHLKAKRIYEIAEEDVKIDGNKIHLG